MARRPKPQPQERSYEHEAWALLLWGLAFFLTTPLLPFPSGEMGGVLRQYLYAPLGFTAYLFPLGLALLGGAVYFKKPLRPLLKHLGFALGLLLLLSPLLGPLGGSLGAQARAALMGWAGGVGLLLPLLLALALLDLWQGKPPLTSLLKATELGVQGVRRVRYAFKTARLRQRLKALAKLYPEHTVLQALGQSLTPEELPKVEEALKEFLRARAQELQARFQAEMRPPEDLEALLQALKNPLPGEGPLRDALEEHRAALFLEAQALKARYERLITPPRLTPTPQGLALGRKALLERQKAWSELESLLKDLKGRFQGLKAWLDFLQAHPGLEAQKEGLKALLTRKPPPQDLTPPPPQEAEAVELDLDLVFPEAPKPQEPVEKGPRPKAPTPPPSPGLALPGPGLLDPPPAKPQEGGFKEAAERLRATIQTTLKDFGVEAQVVGYARGPSVTRYELLPAPGEKISRIQNLQNDLARALAVGAVRVEAPIPGKNTVGLEVPNPKRELVRFSEALLSPAYQNAEALLPLILGKSIEGEIWVRDLAKMPHLLIAGSTGSGKSVAINVLIASLLFKHLPTALRLLLIDPKMVELTPYEGIPHLVRPVVTSPEEAAGVLQGAVAHMERRYRMMSQVGARNLAQYNARMQKEGGETLPYLVIVVDELADLMMTAPKEVEASILRLAQMSRATGMHLILATQRPSVDILTSLIKVNIPARLAFAVTSGFDSRTILDTHGAERLIGQGDALFYQPGLVKPVRLQVPYLSEEEVTRIASFLRAQSFEDRFAEDYAGDFEPPKAPGGEGPGEVDFSDPLLKKAAEIVVEEGYGSVSRLQRRLSIGHARAGKLMDALEAMGIVGPPRGSKPREVLITKDQLKEFFG